MKIDFDPAKSLKNADERNLPFEMVINFDFSTAYTYQDIRKDYSEARYISLGQLDNRLHVLCFTPIAGGIRVISLRKANIREGKIYEKITG